MAAAQVDAITLARHAAVDQKTVHRWLAGRTPHRRHRWAVAALLREDEARLWPQVRGDLPPGAAATSEILAAYGHRSQLPATSWQEQIASASRRIDLLGYAMLFLPETNPNLWRLLRSVACCLRATTFRLRE